MRAHGASLALGIGYFALAAVAVQLTRFEGGVAFLWVANGLLLARLLPLHPQRWRGPLVCSAVGSLLATIFFGLGPKAAPFLLVSNFGEVIGAVWVLRCWLPRTNYLDTLRGLAAFVLIAGFVFPSLGGLLGAGTASAITHGGFWSNWFAWTTGHGLGTVVFAPLVTLALSGEAWRWIRNARLRQLVEAAALLAMVTVVSVAVFAQIWLPLLFLPMLPIMIATVRLGRFGAATGIVILTVTGGLFTLADRGPVHLVTGSAGEHAMFFQFYVAVSAMLVLPVAALLKQVSELISRLAAVEAQFRVIADYSNDAILNVDAEGIIRYASRAVRTLAGFDPPALIGRPVTDLVRPADRAATLATFRNALANPPGPFSSEYQLQRADGELRWFETNSNVVVDAEGEATGLVTLIRDITDRKEAEQALTVAASTDPLTGLPNRRAFTAALAVCAGKVRTGASRCCVAVFDLDHFKTVNDQHGHAAGDHVLQAFAGIATQAVRGGDMVARIGGEEFAVVLRGAAIEEARAVCDRVRTALAAQTLELPDGTALRVTASVGVAQVSAETDAAAMLERADAALYAAKAAGRNCLRIAG